MKALVNMKTEKDKCLENCPHLLPRGLSHDVAMCDHGRIWQWMWMEGFGGGWFLFYPTERGYRKAKKALLKAARG